MKKLFKSISYGLFVFTLIICASVVSAFARSNEVSREEREIARSVQQHEFDENNLKNKIKSVLKTIEKNEAKIKLLEKKINCELKDKLKDLEKKQELLEYQYDTCHWWEIFSARKSLRRNESKIYEVKVKIEESKEKLENLKQKRVKLDEDYAVLLQNQELLNVSFPYNV